MHITRFEDLEIWQEARGLCKLIYKITSREPFSKDFRFRDQIRSACGSIMDNIAEGFGRGGNREFINFLSIAKGSNDEVRSQAHRASDFNYINKDELEDIIFRTLSISKRTTSFITYLKKSERRGPKFDKKY